jgi:hypothetical protein
MTDSKTRITEVGYDDLIDDLVRYGGMSNAEARTAFPDITVALVEEAMQVSDECPFCLVRWVSLPFAMHALGCPIGNGVLEEMLENPNHPG